MQGQEPPHAKTGRIGTGPAPSITGLAFWSIPDGDIRAIRVLKYNCTDACFRVHHAAVGQLHADFFWLQSSPNPCLILEIRPRRIAEAVTLSTVARSESLRHGHLRRI